MLFHHKYLVLMQIDEVDDGEPLEPQQSQPRRPAVFENIEEEVLIGTPTTTPDTNIHKQHSKTICRSTIMIKIFLCQSSSFLVTVGGDDNGYTSISNKQ